MFEEQGAGSLEPLRASCCRWPRSGARRAIGGLIETLKGAGGRLSDRLEDWPGAIAAAEELVTLRATNARDLGRAGRCALERRVRGRRGGCVPPGCGAGAQGTDAASQLRRQSDPGGPVGRGRRGNWMPPRSWSRIAPLLALHRAELAKARGDQVGARRWAEETLRRQPGMREALAMLGEDA